MNVGISHHDIIRIKSKDSSYLSRDLKAKVGADSIKTYEIDIQVEEGDQVERQLSTGKTELYDIYEVIFTEKGVIKPAMFEFKVSKTTAIKRPLYPQTVYVLSGNNSRVYNQSTDNSSNIVSVNSDDLFKELKQILSTQIADNRTLLELADALDQNKKNSEYLKTYTQFIQEATEHLSLIYPFIPGLTALIKEPNP